MQLAIATTFPRPAFDGVGKGPSTARTLRRAIPIRDRGDVLDHSPSEYSRRRTRRLIARQPSHENYKLLSICHTARLVAVLYSAVAISGG